MIATTSAKYRGRRGGLLWVAALLVALLLPVLITNNFIIHTLTIALIYAILASSWDLLFGYAGQSSFGHAGFFGFGAYAAALLTFHTGLSPWLGLFAGGAAAALFALIVGTPSLRLRGVYLALATLACAEMLRIVVSNWYRLTRGTLGFSLDTSFPGIPNDTASHYYVVLVSTVMSIASMYYLAERSRIGLVLRALATDDIRAQALGMDILKMKLLAFAVSGFFAGFAGALYAYVIQLVTPAETASSITILVIAMATIGGVGTIVGPAIAAIVIHVVTEFLHLGGTVYDQIAIGLALMLFVLFLPEGIAGLLRR